MAHVYVDSNAVGAGTGADWANAYTTLAAAATAKAAGDNFWVAHNHAETQASTMTVTFPGTAASPNTCICVDKAGTVPPVAADLRTTATVTTTGAFSITMTGSAYYYGITFNCGSGAVNSPFNVGITGSQTITFTACSLRKLGTTANSAAMLFGGTAIASNRVILNNTTIHLGNIGDQIDNRLGQLVWRNTASAFGGTVPTIPFDNANVIGSITIEGVDLSAITSSLADAYTLNGRILVKNCKLGAGVTIFATAPQRPEVVADVVNCDSGDTSYRNERHKYQASMTTETTIVRTGGASDGTTPIAWKIVTNANNEWVDPFDCPPIAVWNETIGSAITVTVDGIWGNGVVPNNDDIWIDVEYLGTSGFPLSLFATSNKASYLATAAGLSAGTGTWGGSTTKFAMAATFTPQEKGPIYVVVRTSDISETYYIDPKVVIT